MGSFFYNLGKMARPHVRKAKWMWQSAMGSEADAIAVENEVGLDLATEIRRQLQLDPEPAATQLLSRISSKLTPCVVNKLRRFSFETAKKGEPNAFALPGGYIFITRAMLELCQWNEDEIAFILSHEMAHVIRGHAMDRIISNAAISVASKTVHTAGLFAPWLRKVGIKFLESTYSQYMESDADILGVRLVTVGGYDPQASIRLLSRLAELEQASGQSKLSIYFSSHPSIKLRINNIKRMTQST
jgi:beta-barrel assembly-enhancing protease